MALCNFQNAPFIGIIEQMNRSKLGVIDALGLGFELVLRSLWVAVIPIALDLFFWLGPRLSVRPLFEQFVRFVAANTAGAQGLPASVEEIQRFVSQIGASFNLFGLLATDFLGTRFLPVPVVKAFVLADADAPGTAVIGNPPVYTLDNVPLVLLVAAALMLVGLLIGALYLTLIADRLRPAAAGRPLVRRTLAAWFWFVCLGLVVLAAYLFIGIPFSLVFALVSLFSEALAMMLLMLLWVAAIWVVLYAWFVVYAIVLGDTDLPHAFWWSINVVQRNLHSVLGLILLSLLIMGGLSIVWTWLETSWLGSLAAIAGNAYIGSGLAAAAFLFFQDRLAFWQESVAQQRAAMNGRQPGGQPRGMGR
jgi:lysylphosphatidylglycerol synthetase-like protein (DUF2156 family)